jgi:hypothetical protein
MLKLKFLVAFTFALLLYSCQYSDSVFQYSGGNDFVNDPVEVIMIDTLTLNTYTTAIDSIVTSQDPRFMVGRSENKFGIITTCESYFRIDPVEEQNMHTSAVFDSAYMVLHLDGYSFGDTTKKCKMEIFRLTEDITVDKETHFIFNTAQFAHESTPLATFTVDLTNENLDSIIIPLNEYGKELFDLVFNKDVILNDGDLFKLKYKGFVVKPSDDNSSCVVGFIGDPASNSSPIIQICYSDNSITDDLSFNFKIEEYGNNSSSNTAANTNYYASNYFKNDYSKFTSNSFPTGAGKLSSSETGNMLLLQGGFNLRTRIEIPAIDNLKFFGVGSVIKAELIFEPILGTYKNRSDLPEILEMNLISDKNENKGQMGMIGSNNMSYAVLHYNDEFKSETYYSFDITKYVVDEYLSISEPEFSLLMALPQSTVNGNVDQLIVGDQNHPVQKMKLKVYLATY